jgi:hypothetical protein
MDNCITEKTTFETIAENIPVLKKMLLSTFAGNRIQGAAVLLWKENITLHGQSG